MIKYCSPFSKHTFQCLVSSETTEDNTYAVSDMWDQFAICADSVYVWDFSISDWQVARLLGYKHLRQQSLKQKSITTKELGLHQWTNAMKAPKFLSGIVVELMTFSLCSHSRQGSLSRNFNGIKDPNRSKNYLIHHYPFFLIL